MSTPYDAEWLEYDDDSRPDMAFEQSLLRADVRVGNEEAAALQLERVKRLRGRTASREEEKT